MYVCMHRYDMIRYTYDMNVSVYIREVYIYHIHQIVVLVHIYHAYLPVRLLMTKLRGERKDLV